MQITDVKDFLPNSLEFRSKLKEDAIFLKKESNSLKAVKEILTRIRGTKIGAADRLRKDGALEPLSHHRSTTFQGLAGISGM